ncbi:hypothetical protein QW180_27005 [Vibrio sinaloensis]|nr:hypothetical protein [Vibrio sinaloensis]
MASLDPIAFVLDRGLIAKPGEQFRYNGGLVTIIGELLSQQAGGWITLRITGERVR